MGDGSEVWGLGSWIGSIGWHWLVGGGLDGDLTGLDRVVIVLRLGVAGFAQAVAQPFETLIETVAGGGAGGLDVPGAEFQAVQAKLVGDFGSIHGIGQILLVGEDQEMGVPQLVLVEHSLQLLAGLDHTVTIVAVDDEDDALRVLEIMPPKRADLILPSDIPYGELDVLVFDCLNVEANGGDRCHDLTQLEFVEDGRLSCGVQADHQDSHLLLSP